MHSSRFPSPVTTAHSSTAHAIAPQSDGPTCTSSPRTHGPTCSTGEAGGRPCSIGQEGGIPRPAHVSTIARPELSVSPPRYAGVHPTRQAGPRTKQNPRMVDFSPNGRVIPLPFGEKSTARRIRTDRHRTPHTARPTDPPTHRREGATGVRPADQAMEDTDPPSGEGDTPCRPVNPHRVVQPTPTRSGPLPRLRPGGPP